MKKLKILVQFLLLLASVLLGLAFVLRNDAVLPVDLFIVQLDGLTSGALLVLSFVLGGLLGLLVRIPGSLWDSAKLKRQSRLLNKQNMALERLEHEGAKSR